LNLNCNFDEFLDGCLPLKWTNRVKELRKIRLEKKIDSDLVKFVGNFTGIVGFENFNITLLF
jgi:hypothetical protein